MRNKYANGLFALCLIGLVGLSASAQAPADGRAHFQRPAAIPFPSGNPYSAAKAELGRRLFFDPILSRSKTMSCSSCHLPNRSWGDGLPQAIGDNGEPMKRRSPTLFNLAWLHPLGWDGSFPDIESVAFVAITGAANMDLPEAEAVSRVKADPTYHRAFADVFGKTGVTQSTIEAALATYERTIVSGEAPFDRWVGGDEGAISEAAKRGFRLFNGAADCSQCHSGWNFTDGLFHDIGVGKGADVGRIRLVPGVETNRYAFKTPTLRDVAQRGPFMHDGSVETLADVIDLYDKGGIDRPSRSDLIQPLGLSAQQKADLLAFLQTLSSDKSAPGGGALALPSVASGKGF